MDKGIGPPSSTPYFVFSTSPSYLPLLLLLLKKLLLLTSSPSVAIVLLNWNGKAYLQQFLPSVLSTTYANCKVVVADNGSTDDSVSFLKESFPQVDIIQLKKNFGFAKGYNEALKEVEADYYALLNTDIEVTPQWLEPIISLLEEDADHAACQPKLLSYAQRHLFEYAGAAGGWIDAYGYPFARGRLFDVCEEDKGQYDTIEEVFWASGAALVIRSEVFHQLKGFDDFFFAHQEEIDLCWRIQLADKKVFCCPQSVVYHVGGGTLPKGNSKKTFLNYRNNQIMLAKNLTAEERWWKLPLRFLLDMLSAFKALVSGDGGYFVAVIKGQVAFWQWLFFKHKKDKLILERKKTVLKGWYAGSIVWQYFFKKKTAFSQIVREENKLL